MSFINMVILAPIVVVLLFAGIITIHDWYLDIKGINEAEWYQIKDDKDHLGS